MKKIKNIINLLLFCILCSASLFVVSHSFVNEEVFPKWLALSTGVVLTGIVVGILHKKIYIPLNSIFYAVFVCGILIFVRDCLESGINYRLLMQTGCLLMLFFLLYQIAGVSDIRYLFGAAIVLVAALACYGVYQFLFSFKADLTGSFDNVAGFSAALICVLPFTFYFFRDKNRKIGYAFMFIAALLFAAVLLSKARAAIIAGLVVFFVYLCSQYPVIQVKKWLKITLLCLSAIIMTGLYFVKKDSADGRLLIWQNTRKMIESSPVIGQGYSAFNAKYMLSQAEYFETHHDSKYAALADNVLHPFNEYLLLITEQGFAGLACLALLLVLLLRSYFQKPSEIKFIALLSLLALAVLSCFSYPLRYPFSWLIALFCIVLICPAEKVSGIAGKTLKSGIILISCAFLFVCIPLINAEMRWNIIAKQSLAGKTKEVLPEYDKLYKYLVRNGLFLYNHAAELHEAGEYEKSVAVFQNCMKYYNKLIFQMNCTISS